MKKQLFTLIALCSLCFVGCNSTHANKKNLVEDDNISLEVTLERNTSSPYPLDIVYKLTNLSNKTVYYDDFSVPNIYGESIDNFTVQEDGVRLEYKGPTINFYSIGFVSLNSGETYSTFVSLDKVYQVTKGTHNYEVTYRDEIYAKTSDDKTEILNSLEDTDEPLQANELAPKDHTSKIVPVKSNILEFEATINNIRKTYTGKKL